MGIWRALGKGIWISGTRTRIQNKKGGGKKQKGDLGKPWAKKCDSNPPPPPFPLFPYNDHIMGKAKAKAQI